MKKNIVIGVLSLLVVILLGFIVYNYKFKSPNTGNSNTNTNTNSNTDNNNIKSLKDYPANDDENVKTYYLEDLVKDSKVDLNTNFINKSYTTSNGIKYNLSCTVFTEEKVSENYVSCDNVKINIDGFNVFLDYSPNSDGCGNASYLLLNNDYLINQESSGCGEGGPITVYKKDGSKVLEEKYSEYMYNNIGQLKVKNNVLYYLTYPDWNSDKLYFTSYDLNTNEKNVIETINARPSGGKN